MDDGSASGVVFLAKQLIRIFWFEEFVTMTMKSTNLCDVMSCTLVRIYQCFGETRCLCLQGRVQ
jgi:hypothetical protein